MAHLFDENDTILGIGVLCWGPDKQARPSAIFQMRESRDCHLAVIEKGWVWAGCAYPETRCRSTDSTRGSLGWRVRQLPASSSRHGHLPLPRQFHGFQRERELQNLSPAMMHEGALRASDPSRNDHRQAFEAVHKSRVVEDRIANDFDLGEAL